MGPVVKGARAGRHRARGRRPIGRRARRQRSRALPADRGLQAQMLLALILAPSVVLGSLGAIAFLAPTSVDVIVLLPVALSVLARVGAKSENATSPLPAAAQRPDVDGIVERLCVLADLPKPAVVIDH